MILSSFLIYSVLQGYLGLLCSFVLRVAIVRVK